MEKKTRAIMSLFILVIKFQVLTWRKGIRKKKVVAYCRPTLGIHISHLNQGLCFFFVLKGERWII